MHCKLVWLFCQSNKRFIKWIKNFQSLFIGGETLLFFTSRSWSWSSISYASGQNSNDAAWFPNGWQVMDNLHYKLLTFWFRQEKKVSYKKIVKLHKLIFFVFHNISLPDIAILYTSALFTQKSILLMQTMRVTSYITTGFKFPWWMKVECFQVFHNKIIVVINCISKL